jgi:hypothetical protein
MPLLAAFLAMGLVLGLVEHLAKRRLKRERLGCWGTVMVAVLGCLPAYALAMLAYNLATGIEGAWVGKRLLIRFADSRGWMSQGGEAIRNVKFPHTWGSVTLVQDGRPIAEGTLNWSATELTLRPVRPNSIVPQTTTLTRQYLDH